MCQISSLMAAVEGPVVEFSDFSNFEEKKRKSNVLMSFPKIVNQMGSSSENRKILFFRFCRPILDILGYTLLSFSGHFEPFVREQVFLSRTAIHFYPLFVAGTVLEVVDNV